MRYNHEFVYKCLTCDINFVYMKLSLSQIRNIFGSLFARMGFGSLKLSRVFP